MRRNAVLVAFVLALAAPASGSLIEDAVAPTGLTYQEDAGVHGDAPATCETVDPARAVNLDEPQSWGMLVDYDDESDAYGLTFEQADVGSRVLVSLGLGIVTDQHDIAFDVRSPDCGSSVFDPSSAYYNPPPSDPYPLPPAGGAFEATLTGYACDPNQWKFLANQMGGVPAPATIYVEWTDGTYEYVPVDKSTPATVAMYLTSSHLDVLVERAVIVLPATWHGEFKIASGPCDAVQGTPVEGPEQEALRGEFTVQEAGTHVVVVTISKRIVDKVQEQVPEVPTQVNMSCHYTTCLAGFETVSFNMLANTQNA